MRDDTRLRHRLTVGRARRRQGCRATGRYSGAVFPHKTLSITVIAGLASFGLWALPSLAQEIPGPPPENSAPQIAPQEPARPPVTVECPNGHEYRLTTGSDRGVCKMYFERGRVIGSFCTDGANSALQTCSTGCKEITGSGACEKQDPSAPNDAPPTTGG
jgi:hypothetical protein